MTASSACLFPAFRIHRLAALFGLAAAIVQPGRAPAQTYVTYTWTGAVSNSMNDAGNWSNGTTPVSGANTTLAFGSSSQSSLQQNLANPFSLNAVYFSGDTSAYTFSGGAFNFLANSNGFPLIEQDSSSTITFNNDLILGTNLNIGGTGAGTLTFNGTISGGGGLNVNGGFLVSLTGNNTYSGPTNITNGTLRLDSVGALGSSGTISFVSENNTGSGSGTLQFTANNRTDYSGRFDTTTYQLYRIDTNGQNVTFATRLGVSGGTLTKLGAGTLTLTGNSTYTNPTTVSGGTLVVGGNGSLGKTTISVGAGAAFQLTDAATLTAGGGDLKVDGTAAQPASATFGSSGTSSRSRLLVGNNGAGSVTQTSGTFNLTDTSEDIALTLANNPGSSGTYTLLGGTLSTQRAFVGIYGNATFTQTDGRFTTNGDDLLIAFGPNGRSSYNLGGGTLTTGRTQVGDDANAVGTFTQTGGTHTTNTLGLSGYVNSSMGTYSLAGGTLRTNIVIGYEDGSSTARGTSVFHFAGGTLQAGASNTTFMQDLTHADVQAGGAKIDTAGFNITVAQPLLHDTTNAAPARDGGLTKQGTGTLTLAGVNTYTGTTTVTAGTLAITANGGLGKGDVTIAAGGTLTLAAGVTAAHNNATGTTLTLALTSVIDLEATVPGTLQDTVGGLVIDGLAQTSAGTYGSAQSGAQHVLPEFTGTGVILLTPVPEPTAWLMMGLATGLGLILRRRRWV